MAAIVVFGGAGFIGSHLLERLKQLGSHKLISFDIRNPVRVISGVKYERADVRCLKELEVQDTISAIFNLAAIHKIPGHENHEYYETNVLGAIEVTQFARRYSVQELTFTSSISVYGSGEDRKTELSPLLASSAYGWSKILAERVHCAWSSEESNRRLIIVRPAVVFGPGEGGNFTRLAALLRAGIFVYPGRRDAIKACFFIDDLIDAICYARSKQNRLTIFNACYQDEYQLQQIVQCLKNGYFKKAKTFTVPMALIMAAAKVVAPLEAVGFGIHPDRVLKLIRSTNVAPTWLQNEGVSRINRLESALAEWAISSKGDFR